MAADFPTLADIVAQHADSWIGENRHPQYGVTEPGFRSCSCGQWMDDNPAAQFSRASFGAHIQAEWVKACTIETSEQLDALPLNAVVVDASAIPRTSRHGDSHMPGGWTHAGRSPLKSRELADGRPMFVAWHPERDQ